MAETLFPLTTKTKLGVPGEGKSGWLTVFLRNVPWPRNRCANRTEQTELVDACTRGHR